VHICVLAYLNLGKTGQISRSKFKYVPYKRQLNNVGDNNESLRVCFTEAVRMFILTMLHQILKILMVSGL